MSLVAFLAGQRAPRANPARPWRLQYRHREGGPWTALDEAGTEEGARESARSPTVALDHGDLVRLLSPEGVVCGFWVRAEAGLVDAGRLPLPIRNLVVWNWEAVWEESPTLLVPAAALVETVWGVDRSPMARLGCALALLACDDLLAEDDEAALRRALAQVARHQDEPLPTDELLAATAAADWAAGRYRRYAEEADEADEEVAERAGAAASAARDLVHFAAGTRGPEFFLDAVGVCTRGGPDRQAAARDLVRRALPLPLVLLARAGDRVPPGAWPRLESPP